MDTEEKQEELKNEAVVEAELTEEEKEAVEDYKAAYEFTPEQRLTIIKDFNERNKGIAHIEDEEATEDEKNAAIEEFTVFNNEYASRRFLIADAANSLRVARFLKQWNEKSATWKGHEAIGVVNFDALLKQFIEDKLKDDSLELILDWGPISFLYSVMGNYGGVGLKTAAEYELIREEFEAIKTVVDNAVNEYQEDGKKLSALQMRAQYYTMGYKLVLEEQKDYRMSKEELLQELQENFDKNESYRKHIYDNYEAFGLTKEEADKYCLTKVEEDKQ